MATLALTSARSFSATLSDAWQGLVKGYQLYREYKHTLSELQALSDRDIADLGQCYKSREQLAFQAVYGNLNK